MASATRSDVHHAIARARSELTRAAALVDDLVDQAETALGDAEHGADADADEIIGRTDEMDELREARELLALADDQVDQASALIGS